MRLTSGSVIAAVAVTAALLPSAASAGPISARSGDYEATVAGGKIGFSLGILSKRLIHMKGSVQVTCPDGSKVTHKWDSTVYGPKTGAGQFTYAGEGVVLRGRFTSSARANGTIDVAAGDCTALGLKWKAKQTDR